jgi:hypothetical protein
VGWAAIREADLMDGPAPHKTILGSRRTTPHT